METKGRVLVIDDEVGIRMGCQRALSSQNYEVDSAASGEEGLEKIAREGYDLVLLDIMMPGMGGMETLKCITEIDPNLVCVVITGYATVELAVQAIKQGAYDFITKPFDADTLILTVDQGMEKRLLSLQAQRLAEMEARARELAHQKEELERLDRIKSTFTLTVAHELRAPVAAIQSYLRLILDGYIPPEKQRHYLERAEQRALAQLDLITDLLDLAHLQDPDRQVETEPVQLDQVLDDVLDALAARATEKQIEVETDVAAGPACGERGPAARQAVVDQPGEQRDQVHAQRWTGAHLAAYRGGPPCRLGPGHRHRHLGRRAAAHL